MRFVCRAFCVSMDDRLILEIVKMLSGSPSVWSSILLAAFLLKKYVINGSISRALLLKEREIAALTSLDDKLTSLDDKLGKVLQYQQEFNALLSARECVGGKS